MTIDAMELGRSVRIVREKRGMVLREVAEATGLTLNYVWMIENGQRAPSVDALNKIAKALNVPAPCLTMLGFRPRGPESAYRKTVDATKAAILAVIDAD